MRGKFLSIIVWLSAVLIFYCVAPAFAYHDKTGERTLASLRKIKNRFSFAVVGDSQGGGGAQLYSSEKDGGFFHFIVANIDGDKAGFTVVDRNGLIRDFFPLVRK